jgi:hypothetical protein
LSLASSDRCLSAGEQCCREDDTNQEHPHDPGVFLDAEQSVRSTAVLKAASTSTRILANVTPVILTITILITILSPNSDVTSDEGWILGRLKVQLLFNSDKL